MSWDCPYWNNNICKLNGITCKPGKGQCVLKGRFEIKTGKKSEVKVQIEQSDKKKKPPGKGNLY